MVDKTEEKIKFIMDELNMDRTQAEVLWEKADSLCGASSLRRYLSFGVIYGFDPSNKQLREFNEIIDKVVELQLQDDIEGISLKHLTLVGGE